MHKNIIKGHCNESRFIIAATEHGFRTSQPVFRDGAYDFIIEKGSTLWKVQVKSLHFYKKPAMQYSTQQDKNYDDIDIFAACHPNTYQFYLIPTSKMPKRKRYLSIGKKSKYEKYLNNWELKE